MDSAAPGAAAVALDAVALDHVSKRFGARAALHDVSLRIPAGTRFGLLGLNGAGKTTLLRLLAGLHPASAGSVRVAGLDVRRDPAGVRRGLGYMGEEPAAPMPPWTAWEYLATFARVQGLPRARVGACLRSVGLDPEAWHRDLAGHSAGMRRRVEIARALLADPPLLVLDEPTRELDLAGKAELWAMLRALPLHRRTLVFSSHDVAEIRHLASEVGVLRGGRLAYRGPLPSPEALHVLGRPDWVAEAAAFAVVRYHPSTGTSSMTPRDPPAARQLLALAARHGVPGDAGGDLLTASLLGLLGGRGAA